jgi:predicted Zn-dependent protease
MQLLERLHDHLMQLSLEGETTWLLSATLSQQMSAGLQALEMAGVYGPVRKDTALKGKLSVQWQSGLASSTQLTRSMVAHPEQLIETLRELAFDDPFAAIIPEPECPACVPVFDEAIASRINSPATEFFSSLFKCRKTFQALNTRNCAATVSYHKTSSFIASSKGLYTRFNATEMDFGATADSLFSVSAASRRPLAPEDFDQRLAYLAEMVSIQRNRVSPSGTPAVVILLPSVALAFVDKYLLENLSAEKIHAGRSAFRCEDIDARTHRFHETWSVIHDPCRFMHIGSYPMDGQGLAARRIPLIQNGVLMNGDVSLKGARLTGWPATPAAGADSLILSGAFKADLSDYIRTIEYGYLIPNVLGLHTQDSGRGDYSVAVPHGILIQNGRMMGAAKGILTGNFFEDLSHEMTVLSSPYHDFTGLAFSGQVRF